VFVIKTNPPRDALGAETLLMLLPVIFNSRFTAEVDSELNNTPFPDDLDTFITLIPLYTIYELPPTLAKPPVVNEILVYVTFDEPNVPPPVITAKLYDVEDVPPLTVRFYIKNDSYQLIIYRIYTFLYIYMSISPSFYHSPLHFFNTN
jgi:hypothetical protein